MQIGIDCVEKERVYKLSDKVKRKIFTEYELNNEDIAKCFAVKECMVKAFGGWLKMKWREVELRHYFSGQPVIKFYGDTFKMLGNRTVQVTITDEAGLVIAKVVLLP